MLLPAYRPLLRHTPTQRTITVWPSDAVPALQDCFQESWTWRTTHRLSSATSASAQSDQHQDSNRTSEPETLRLALRAAQRQLAAGLKRAKAAYAQRIQGHFTSNDPRSVWRGITDCNTRDAQCPRDPSLQLLRPLGRSEHQHQIHPSTRRRAPSVTAAELRRTLQRINPRKAAGPDNISGEKMICRILLLLTLTSCVCGTFVVNVTQSSYQAEENQNITLEWTFTTKPHTSPDSLFIFCEKYTEDKTLFHVHEGVEVPESQHEQFAGRVQFEKDVLRGRTDQTSCVQTQD
ncbi:hypothetical protein L3Q82_002276 [Scortum barcoo]|uniref:Uncharacterized protein n=1 Tax=Scortum barcoo TaxID=214431 RepID=A0ACB8W028_9TELE|nr:hypothetical protein L3Q82_002276 [Scortum barcoo]